VAQQPHVIYQFSSLWVPVCSRVTVVVVDVGVRVTDDSVCEEVDVTGSLTIVVQEARAMVQIDSSGII